MSQAPTIHVAELSPMRYAAIGAVASIICLVGAAFDPVQFMRAYLPAWLFFWGLALGSMVLLMIYHLVGGAWGYLLRRILEAGMGTLPLVTLLFVPIAVARRLLYPWAQPDLVAASAKLQHQTFYMNTPYFFARAITYFVLWLFMSWCLIRLSRRQDQGENPHATWLCNQFGAFGAVVYGVTLHFAAIDWGMSIMPAFHSTIWGPVFALGQMLSALALAVIAFSDRAGHAPLASVVSRQAMNDMGSLLLTFIVACAYMGWFQFMLIWIANLPVDVIYYLPRTNTFWLGMTWLIVLLAFAAPFVLLLMRPIKRNAVHLARVAKLILIMQLVYVYYQITPMFGPHTPAELTNVALAGLGAHWMDFVMPVAMGGFWLAFFQWRLSRWPLLVAGDEQLAQALYLRHLDSEETAREEVLQHE